MCLHFKYISYNKFISFSCLCMGVCVCNKLDLKLYMGIVQLSNSSWSIHPGVSWRTDDPWSCVWPASVWCAAQASFPSAAPASLSWWTNWEQPLQKGSKDCIRLFPYWVMILFDLRITVLPLAMLSTPIWMSLTLKSILTASVVR